MRKTGLRRKIVLALLVIGTIPVVVGIMVIYFIGTAKLKEAIGANFQGLATETGRKVDQWIRDHGDETHEIEQDFFH